MQNAFDDYSSAGPIDQLTQDGVDYFEFDDPAGNGHYFVHVALYSWLLDRIDNLAATSSKTSLRRQIHWRLLCFIKQLGSLLSKKAVRLKFTLNAKWKTISEFLCERKSHQNRILQLPYLMENEAWFEWSKTKAIRIFLTLVIYVMPAIRQNKNPLMTSQRL